MRQLLLLFLMLATAHFSAQNSLRLYSANGELFKAALPGSPMNIAAQTDVLLEGLLRDTVTVSIALESGAKSDVTVYLLDQGEKTLHKEYNYRIEPGKEKMKVTFTGMYDQVRLPNPLVPLKPVVDTSYKYNNNILEHFCELKEGKPIYFNNLPVTGTCTTAMPPAYLKYACLLIDHAQTDDEKYRIVENACRNNCLLVKQLCTLLQYISFEVEKLKLVKIAYFNLVDVANKKELEKAFRFESSVAKLNDFFAHAAEYRIRYGDHCKTASDSLVIKKFCTELAVFKNDAERYSALKKMYEDYCFSVPQVKQVLQQFIHDREKLDAAELMYFYCVDKKNYAGLNDAFSYKESSGELQDFVSKQNR